MLKVASCYHCGKDLPTSQMHKVANPKTKYSYYCPECFRMMYGYSDEVGANTEFERILQAKNVMEENGFKKSVAKVISITTGFELEVGYGVDANHFRILQSYGYKPTYDCTVQIEYKSPIYRNLNGIAKLLYSVIENGAGSVGNGAGTHVNVWSENLTSTDYKRIRAYYNTLFYALYERVRSDRNHHELFGRNMRDCEWACEFGNNYHSAFINTESCKIDHPRIEFRLCKYENNVQFMNCLKFCNECMKTILVNFCNNYISDRKALAMGKTTEWATKHNEHKAQVAANKLVNVYNKYRGF